MERRLTTILAADIAGYSQLMSADEERITQRLSRVRDIFFNRVAEASGEVFGEAGDGFFAEFASPMKAVQCAVEIQRDLALENRDIIADKKMLFRIGIHLADVIVENDTLLGDGVNIAARIETDGAPGQVHVSAQVFDHVGNKLGLCFDCLGPRSFKNIDGTTTVYAVAGEIGAYRLITSKRKEDIAPALPDKPSIALLPFINMSDDTEQEYFADGITEDLITEMSRFKSIFVISRHASFAYKGERIDPRQVGRELGVGFLLEGSIRRLGQRVRITAQLIETETNNHVWAEHYDARNEELFDIQDDLIKNIVATIAGRIGVSVTEAAKRKPPESLEAYDCLLQGLSYHQLGGNSRENAEQAVHWIDKAIALSPGFARAHAWRACAGAAVWLMDDEGEWLKRCNEDCQLALELDQNEPEAHRIAGAISLHNGDFQKSEYHHLRAMELNPNDAYLKGKAAVHYIATNDCEKALEQLTQAMRQDPFLPEWAQEEEAVALYFLNRHEEATKKFKSLISPNRRALSYWVANQWCIADVAQTDSARNALLRIDPEYSVADFIISELPFSDRNMKERVVRDLTEAGLPV
jgi:adenylate cyclase